MSSEFPCYLGLVKSGELAARASALQELLSPCRACPRLCQARRLEGQRGICNSGALAAVCSVFPHMGEEPAVTGVRGSGCIFFAQCNLRCVFCQNWQISQGAQGSQQPAMSTQQLAEKMLWLQEQGCHNINLVSPTHVVAQIVAALSLAAAQGLRLPLVYNSNGYDSVEVLRLLDGVVDIYLPDLKYSDSAEALRYSGVRDYWEAARAAVREMFRQVGELQLDDSGVARRGLIIRHLILPNDLSGTEEVLCWVAGELSAKVAVSLMSQYYPTHRSNDFALLSRKIRLGEHAAAVRCLEKFGLEHGWVQDFEDAPDYYQPDFEREAPFVE